MNYLKIEKKYRNNCLKASQAEGREFESRLPLVENQSLIGFTCKRFFILGKQWVNILPQTSKTNHPYP
ncbi:hypothetical protein KCV26_05390 [Petrimonas sulfuriphila]|uniref:hypothetical protein n=1 Tax=Petrimonas sulfuriphila TaxID=285070 RepID=UPI00324B8EEF